MKRRTRRPNNTPCDNQHTIFRKTCEKCRALQTEYYQKLKDKGFDDWELRREKDGNLSGELNNARLGSGNSEVEATMSSLDAAEEGLSDSSGNDNAALAENLDVFGQPTTIWDTPVAEHWRFIAGEVDALPVGYPNRAFLVRWAELGGIVVAAAQQTKITRWKGREAVRKFKAHLRKTGRLA